MCVLFATNKISINEENNEDSSLQNINDSDNDENDLNNQKESSSLTGYYQKIVNNAENASVIYEF